MGQIQARWQTSQPGPRRPRTTSPIPAFPGALGRKEERDREPGRSGAPTPPPAFRRTDPGLCGPPPVPRVHPDAALPTSAPGLLLRLGGREGIATNASRGPHRRGASASAAARAFRECCHPGLGPHPASMLGVRTQASWHPHHVRSGVSERAEEGRKQSFRVTASQRRKRLESDSREF